MKLKNEQREIDNKKHYAWAIMFSPLDPKYKPVLIHFQFHTSGNASESIVKSVTDCTTDLISNGFNVIGVSYDGDAFLRKAITKNTVD